MYEEKLNGKTWTAENDMASEHELGDFLYGLIRLEKPRHVIETGTYDGDAAERMSEALAENGHGMLDTCDIDDRHQAERFDNDFCQFWHMSGTAMLAQIGKEMEAGVNTGIDFAFLDSGGDRLEEAKALWPLLANHSIVVIHDIRRKKEQEASEWLISMAPAVQLIEFATPRGLVVIRLMKSLEATGFTGDV